MNEQRFQEWIAENQLTIVYKSLAAPGCKYFYFLVEFSIFFYEYAYWGKNFHLLPFIDSITFELNYEASEKIDLPAITYRCKGEKELMNCKQV